MIKYILNRASELPVNSPSYIRSIGNEVYRIGSNIRVTLSNGKSTYVNTPNEKIGAMQEKKFVAIPGFQGSREELEQIEKINRFFSKSIGDTWLQKH